MGLGPQYRMFCIGAILATNSSCSVINDGGIFHAGGRKQANSIDAEEVSGINKEEIDEEKVEKKDTLPDDSVGVLDPVLEFDVATITLTRIKSDRSVDEKYFEFAEGNYVQRYIRLNNKMGDSVHIFPRRPGNDFYKDAFVINLSFGDDLRQSLKDLKTPEWGTYIAERNSAMRNFLVAVEAKVVDTEKPSTSIDDKTYDLSLNLLTLRNGQFGQINTVTPLSYPWSDQVPVKNRIVVTFNPDKFDSASLLLTNRFKNATSESFTWWNSTPVNGSRISTKGSCSKVDPEKWSKILESSLPPC